ncbi:necrosis inducing protein (NPP1) [Streptomyces sp. SLBN-118]|uniref:NPP1 family protein n=1 Tax=Streptomyces sp. SLBN-118 TaxID=2768454 RepID=UPI00115347F1|nr:NPP1 family protein [Streptomyces sp. SLBN-118]TQK50422.1 necrosis inducing protein (NPP1) [Streptomyces sp. SLBN-118]
MSHRPRRVRTGSVAAVSLLSGLLFVTGPGASANEPLPEGPATLQDFAAASVPQWNFARANRNDPCWPESAFDGNGNPADGGNVQYWPNSDGGCAPHGAPFPTYYTVQKCNADEIRVAFTIYQATSGFRPSGHRHDFEHVEVVWRKNGTAWTRDRLLLSAHGDHRVVAWGNAESWNHDRGHAAKGLEHPRIFVGYGSHSMYNNQGGLKDVISAYTNEYRHADHPVWADQGGGLVEVAKDSPLQQKFEANAGAWGSANGNPGKVARESCSH